MVLIESFPDNELKSQKCKGVTERRNIESHNQRRALIFDSLILSKMESLFESLSIQNIIPLMNAAKKHQTEVRYSL